VWAQIICLVCPAVPDIDEDQNVMSNLTKMLYDGSPAFIQNCIITGFSTWLHHERYGSGFRKYCELLGESERYSKADLAAYQDEQLQRIIKHAYETVPHYRRIFDSRKLKPIDVRSEQDLQKLPVLTRKDIQSNFDDLRTRAIPRSRLRLGHTSGTTGSPLEIYYDANVIHMTYALMDRQYHWAGAALKKFGDRIAVLRGNVVVPVSRKYPPFWRHNYFHNQLLLSSFHLAQENLPAYLSALEEFSPVVIDGYPSTVYLLARYLLSEGRTLPVRAVVTGSETLYDFQRTAIEKAFECRVFDYFAAAERVVFAAECDRHEGHHLSTEYGITEILNNSYQPVLPGQEGLLVGTSLQNYGMPLIRYVTNDVSALKNRDCSCGRALPLMEDVSTKAEDILALKDGRMISPSVLTHPFKPMHSVDQSQIVQEDYDRITIRIVPNGKYRPSDAEHLIREFKARLGEDMHIKIDIVDALPRNKSGKFKWVISKVEKGIQVP
jgi:phenylacetate-CoA ligase